MRSNWQARFPAETGLTASALLAQAAHCRLSDTSRNCSVAVPTPSATGHQLHAWGQWNRLIGLVAGKGREEGTGEGCLVLRPEPRL